MSGQGRDHYYKRDPVRARRGMRGLTLEEKAVYQEIIDLTYEFGRPPVDDQRRMAHECECDVRVYKRVRDSLAAKGRIRIVDGRLIDERSVATLAARADARAQAVDGTVDELGHAQPSAQTSTGSGRDVRRTSGEASPELRGFHNPVFNENKDPQKRKLESESELDTDSTYEDDEDDFTGALARAEFPPTNLVTIAGGKAGLDDLQLNQRCLGFVGPRPVAAPLVMLASIDHIRALMASGCDLERDIGPVIAQRTANAAKGAVVSWRIIHEEACRRLRNSRLAASGDPLARAQVRAGLKGRRR